MRRAGFLAVSLVLAVAPGAGTAASRTPAVPLAAQKRLVRSHPDLAAVPTRLPLRTTFVGWRYDPRTAVVVERFQDVRFPGDPEHALTLTVRRFAGACSAGKARTLQMGGNRVYVDATGEVAWRCLGPPAIKVAGTGPSLPDVGLGRVLASVKRVG
jgi:hypothetical protein